MGAAARRVRTAALMNFFPPPSTANTWAGSCTRCHGSRTSVCSTGAPISFRTSPDRSTSSSATRAARDGEARRPALRHRLAGRALRRAHHRRSSNTSAHSADASSTTDGRVVVNRPEAVRALEFMRDELYESHVAPLDVLTWHEEEARFAFQNGNAVFMRNWPYAVAAMSDTAQSRVAGKFAVSPMPASATPGGHSTAALGGAQLAINAYTESPGRGVQADRVSHRAGADAPARAGSRSVSDAPALYDDPRLRGSTRDSAGEREARDRERDAAAGDADLHRAVGDTADRAAPGAGTAGGAAAMRSTPRRPRSTR